MCNSFHYLRGGAERCFLDLMALMRDHGHEVIPFSMQHDLNLPSEYESYFVDHIDFPKLLDSGASLPTRLKAAGRLIHSREAAGKIDRLIRDTRPDIAHVHGIAHEISPSILPAIKNHGLPIVQTLHDYKLLCPNTSFVSNGEICERCKGGRFYNATRNRCKRGSLAASAVASLEAYVHRISRIYSRNVDRFIAPSEFLARKVTEFDISTDVVNIPNFIDVDNFEPAYEPEPFYVFAGRLVEVKGIRTLIRAAENVPKGTLYVAGSGDLENQLKAYVAERGLHHVVFLGHLPTDELIALLQRAAFTVLPSEWYENYPMSALEALACGTPVIGADIGGIPEIVRDGETGLLFEPGNADQLASKIEFLLDNREESVRMGRAGRARIEQLNGHASHYAATLAVYENLLASGSGRRRATSVEPGEPGAPLDAGMRDHPVANSSPVLEAPAETETTGNRRLSRAPCGTKT
jgi:glycosyltransferase involved in cell wall biosynthesis